MHWGLCTAFVAALSCLWWHRAAASAAHEVVNNNNYYYCYASSNSSVTKNCTVYYNETVVLVCPVNGFWYKGGKQLPGGQANHTIEKNEVDELTFIDNNGLYYCQETKDGPRYNLNLIVKAPPEFTDYMDQKFNPKNNRYLYVQLKDLQPEVNITVEVVGYGPFRVFWTLNYTSNDACKAEQVKCSQTIINETATLFTYQIMYPYTDSMVGYYKATVSNSLGNDSAVIHAVRACKSYYGVPERVKPDKKVETKQISSGKTLTLDCIAQMSAVDSYGICYGYKNETFAEVFEKEGRMLKCSHGICNESLSGLTVENYTIYLPNDCNRHGVTVVLNELEEDLTFYCHWKANNIENGYFGQYDVKVQATPVPPPTPHANNVVYVVTGSSTAGGVVLIVVVILVVIISVSMYRKRTRLQYASIYHEEDGYSRYEEDNYTRANCNSSITSGPRQYGSVNSLVPELEETDIYNSHTRNV